MRIVHLTSVHSPYDVRIFHKECKTLSKAGYKVTLVAPHDRDEVLDGIQIVAIPRQLRRLRRMTSCAAYAYRKALQLDADLYHFHDPELIPVGLLLCSHGKQVVYDIHEDMPRSLLSRAYLPPWLRRLVSCLAEQVENLAARRFSALVAVTPAIGARFQMANPRTVVINNYPLRDEFSAHSYVAWNERQNSVAYVGRITLVRGAVQMVEAMKYVADSFNATLELAGGFGPKQLRGQVVQLPGWKRVHELGVLDRIEVARLLGRVKAGLVLFLPEPNHIQAQPNKLFEYMAAGIPVIASDFALWREKIEESDCGLLVNSLDPIAIARSIEYLLSHPQGAEDMGRRGREAVIEKYNWENESKKLLDLYAQLLEEKR